MSVEKILWIASERRRFTVKVTVRDGIIVTAAPIVRVFVGQPLDNLVRWAAPSRVVVLAEEEPE